MNEILLIIILTLIPALELRASIPYGIITGVSWPIVFITAVITNIILGIVIYLVLDKLVHIATKIKLIEKIYNKIVNRTQRRIHNAVDKYGTLGVAIFIGIPLPGSGVYTGALGSYLIGLDFKHFLKACIYGVLIAGVIVTLIMVLGNGAIAHLFVKT